ncbi:hypothetical protein MPSEU_000878500 [Mayamaea pseudoterrestris]|nr:hypothetical protein MPSEU_000878500 [Mayamaea pseudoterrestris]
MIYRYRMTTSIYRRPLRHFCLLLVGISQALVPAIVSTTGRHRPLIKSSLLRMNQDDHYEKPFYSSSLSSSPNNNQQYNRRKQLQWIVNGLQKTRADDTMLLDALGSLTSARNSQQVSRAGRQLETWWLKYSNITDICTLERAACAAAMTGLSKLALSMVSNANATVSYQTQDAICGSLRRAGKIQLLQDTVLDFGSKAIAHRLSMSVVSFNILLAALCETASDVSPDRRKTMTVRATSRAALLHDASQWLLQRNETLSKLGLEPNVVSFATVLQAAASVGNVSLADSLWGEMQLQKLPPNIFAYNARLRLLAKKGKTADKEMLDLWKEIEEDSSVTPDRYSVDWIIVPLARTGQNDKMEAILDSFVSSNSNNIASDAFAAYLLRLTRAGELTAARRLFDVYMLPTLQSVVRGTSGEALRMVKPSSRHFNVLLDGYKQMIEIEIARDATSSSPLSERWRREAWELYSIMLNFPGLNQESYTYTIMMGLCSTASQLTRLLKQVEIRGHSWTDCSSSYFRAALTNFGRLGDASSACFLFARFAAGSGDLRIWKVFLGAIASSARVDAGTVVNIRCASISTASVANANTDVTPAAVAGANTDVTPAAAREFTRLVDGFTCSELTMNILECITSARTLKHVSVPQFDAQFYCLMASALQHGGCGSTAAIRLYRTAAVNKIPADGRFVNAMLRCFGANIKDALAAWKNEIRKDCLEYERRPRSSPPSIQRSKGKNLVAAYHGLLYVAGRAGRPDIGLRLVYAMQKEKLAPDETALNCFLSGKRVRVRETMKKSPAARLASQFTQLLGTYESLLYVECVKYDQNDKRRVGEKRVRIILE